MVYRVRHSGSKYVDRQRSCYQSRTLRDAPGDIRHRRTRPYRPQTNGKVERFHRTLADEWAYARLYTSDPERCDEFPPGYTPTITTAATPHSAANHPPAAYLTSQVSTPRQTLATAMSRLTNPTAGCRVENQLHHNGYASSTERIGLSGGSIYDSPFPCWTGTSVRGAPNDHIIIGALTKDRGNRPGSFMEFR